MKPSCGLFECIIFLITIMKKTAEASTWESNCYKNNLWIELFQKYYNYQSHLTSHWTFCRYWFPLERILCLSHFGIFSKSIIIYWLWNSYFITIISSGFADDWIQSYLFGNIYILNTTPITWKESWFFQHILTYEYELLCLIWQRRGCTNYY